jgi:site-specific DNA-methyltransferase (adenine-specific)
MADRSPIKIYNEDCLTGIPSHILPGSVSVIVTSPPYNIGKNYSQYRDDLESGAYLDWIERVARTCSTALNRQGSFFLNLGSKPSAPWWPIEVASRVREVGFTLQNTILWVKSISISPDKSGTNHQEPGELSFGHYKPVNSSRFVNGLSEYIFHFTKKGDVSLDKLGIGVPYQDKSNVTRWKTAGSDLRDRGNVWFVPYDTIHNARSHPCIFPVKLPEMCIRLHGLSRTKLVLDPFLGTGSTALACDRLGVRFIGFDIDPKYAEIAKQSIRLQGDGREESRQSNPSQTPVAGSRTLPRDIPNA